MNHARAYYENLGHLHHVGMFHLGGLRRCRFRICPTMPFVDQQLRDQVGHLLRPTCVGLHALGTRLMKIPTWKQLLGLIAWVKRAARGLFGTWHIVGLG